MACSVNPLYFASMGMYETIIIYSFTDYFGKSSPGINIDVYLQPLIQELKLLWDGVVVFYAYNNEYFNMRAILRCIINDFPAYTMLSSWSTKGYIACPSCVDSTHSYMFGGKICCVGHRRWLPCNHPYCAQGHLFDGTEEFRDAPVAVDGIKISVQQDRVGYVYEKSKKGPKKKKGR